jgi:hypothetical protein
MKRSISIAFCAILLISLFCGPAKAATYSSEYLRYYNASLQLENTLVNSV